MAHVHADETQTYYLDQLCTIGVGGAFGAVAVLLYTQGGLWFLVEEFRWPVLAGGIALLVMVAVRAVTLWFSVGRPAVHDHSHDHEHGHTHDHDHAHEHGPDCAHDHAHDEHIQVHRKEASCCHHDHEPALAGAAGAHAHDHGHDHSHGWNPVRYAVLLLPITFFFLGLPNERGFSADRLARADTGRDLENSNLLDMQARGDGVIQLGFKELEQVAYLPERRAELEGKVGMLKGQYLPGKTPTACRLVRMKMTCCAADAIPLNVRIVSPQPFANLKPGQWVQVTGQIQFRKLEGVDEYKPVLQLKALPDIVPIEPETNPFLL